MGQFSERRSIERFPDKEAMLTRIKGAENSYLPAYPTAKFIILPHKLAAEEIGVYSISGQKFLPLSHTRGTDQVTLPIILYFYLGLYVLGFITRYAPDIWTPFVRADSSGERQFIERFVQTARRVVPNLALNAVHHTRFVFVTHLQGIVDLSTTLTSEEIREIVRKEIEAS